MIGENYSSKKVYIRSTDVDRNLESALIFAAGMFPPSEDEVWNKDLNWQPIAVHTIPLNDDYLLFSNLSCPRFDQLYKFRM